MAADDGQKKDVSSVRHGGRCLRPGNVCFIDGGRPCHHPACAPPVIKTKLKVKALPANPGRRRRYMYKVELGGQSKLNKWETLQAGMGQGWHLRAIDFSRPVGFIHCAVINPEKQGHVGYTTNGTPALQYRWIADGCGSLELGVGEKGWNPVNVD